MSEDKEYRIFLPTLEESIAAFRVALEIKSLIETFATTGKCDANGLIMLGHALQELEDNLTGRSEIYLRWEDLQELEGHTNECPELLSYCNYYGVFNDKKLTIHHFERTKEGTIE